MDEHDDSHLYKRRQSPHNVTHSGCFEMLLSVEFSTSPLVAGGRVGR
jgi:hypothetical protein